MIFFCMKHVFKVLIILFFFNANLKAGSEIEFREGYVISLKGDTTKGLLLTQISKSASEKCIFKPSAKSETIIYQPGEITGYRYLDGKYYVSKEISKDSISKKVVFLEFLIKGIANVYYYVDNEEHYYIEKLPDGLLELTEKQRTFLKEGHNYISPSTYRGKLIYIMRDYPGISSEIQATKLNHQSLIKLTKDYHEKVCNSESCIIYQRDNVSTKVNLGIIVGFSENQYNFGGQCISNYGNNYQIGAALKLSNVFMFNEHLNFKINVLFEKDSKSYTLSLPKPNNTQSCQITYNNISYNLIDLRYLGNLNAYLPSVKADLNVIDLKIPISLNYDFNISKKTIYTCGLGISNKIILSQNKNFKVDQFYACYGKSINSLLTGAILTTGIEGKWFGKNTQFINVGYEYLTDFRSKIDNTLKLSNNQLSMQIGMYF